MEFFFHAQQFFTLTFQHLVDGYASPARHDFGNFIFCHFITQQFEFLVALDFSLIGFLQLFLQLRDSTVLQFGHFLPIAAAASDIKVETSLLQRFLDAGCPFKGFFLPFPDFFQSGVIHRDSLNLIIELGQLRLGSRILFFLQRFPFNFQLNQPTFEAIHILGF